MRLARLASRSSTRPGTARGTAPQASGPGQVPGPAGRRLSVAVVIGDAGQPGLPDSGGFRLADGQTLGEAEFAAAHDRIAALPYSDPAKTPSENVLAILRSAARTPGGLDQLLLSEIVERLRPLARSGFVQRVIAAQARELGLQQDEADLIAAAMLAPDSLDALRQQEQTSWPAAGCAPLSGWRAACPRGLASRAHRGRGCRGRHGHPQGRSSRSPGPARTGGRAAGRGHRPGPRRHRMSGGSPRSPSSAARGVGSDGRGPGTRHLETQPGVRVRYGTWSPAAAASPRIRLPRAWPWSRALSGRIADTDAPPGAELTAASSPRAAATSGPRLQSRLPMFIPEVADMSVTDPVLRQ